MPTPRVEAKIKYYDKEFRNQGWAFAYLYPSMQRANQSSGRPIRKESDNKLRQTNLRALCGCSAYAFHRTRNKIWLK